MNTFRKLWQAIENMAASLNSLATTVDATNQEIRQRVGIPVDAGPSLLIESNGEVETVAMSAGRKRKS